MPKPLITATRKQRAFAEYLLKHPKASGTEAALATYNASNENTAGVQAWENLRNPKVLAILEKSTDSAQARIAELVHDDDKRLSFDASRDVLDRTYGKATQRLEVQSTAVAITIDLTANDVAE